MESSPDRLSTWLLWIVELQNKAFLKRDFRQSILGGDFRPFIHSNFSQALRGRLLPVEQSENMESSLSERYVEREGIFFAWSWETIVLYGWSG